MYISNYCRWRSQFFNQGGGTSKWQKIEGKFLLSSSSDYKLNNSGGNSTVTLTINELPAHTHSISSSGNHTHTTNSTGSHSHTFTRPRGDQDYNNGSGNTWWGGTNGITVTTNSTGNHSHSIASSGAHTHTANSSGLGKPFNIMPLYLVVNTWKRIS